MPGPGLVQEYPYSNGKQAALYNFDVDRSDLKAEHTRWLRENLCPILSASDGHFALLAQASPTGSRAHNLALSKRRGTAVLEFLSSNVPRQFPIRRATAVGEGRALLRGEPDEEENPWYRSVLVIGAHQPPQLPPRLPPPPPPFQLPCDYYRFEIAWLTGLAQAWALSLQANPGRDLTQQGFMKPAYEHFLNAMSIAMRDHYRSVSRAELDRMWEWYRGEPLPNGPYEFINDSGPRRRRLREQQERERCRSGTYNPPQLEPASADVQPWQIHPHLRGRQF